MVLASAVLLLGPHSGEGARLPPQKPGDMPQNPKALQQTLRGQTDELDHWMPHPGSHSLFQSHCEMQLEPQKSGPPPQTPFPVTASLRVQGQRLRGARTRWDNIQGAATPNLAPFRRRTRVAVLLGLGRVVTRTQRRIGLVEKSFGQNGLSRKGHMDQQMETHVCCRVSHNTRRDDDGKQDGGHGDDEGKMAGSWGTWNDKVNHNDKFMATGS